MRHPGPRPGLVAAAIALVTGVYLWNTWERDFWAPEEPDFAAVMKEMEAPGGSKLVPKIGGRMYAEKPPLLYWCAYIARAVTGADPRFAWRLPSALAAALLLWATYLAGRRFFDGRTGATASLVLATSVVFYECGSWFLTDILFAAGCGVAVLSFGTALLFEPGVRRWPLIGWAALGLAALSKSFPLALALVLGPVGAFILLDLFLERSGPGLIQRVRTLRPLLGTVVFLAIVAPWYLAMYARQGWPFIQIHFLEHHISRLYQADSHPHGLAYYLGTIPVDLIPWTVFLPLAVFFGRVQIRRAPVRYFVVWGLFTIVFLSPISSKQGKYLLPMWPALSMVIAAGLLSPERESIWEGFLGEKLLRGMGWALRIPLPIAIALAAYWGCGGDLKSMIVPFAPSHERDIEAVLSGGGLAMKVAVLALIASAGFYAAGVWLVRRLNEGRTASAVGGFAAATLLAYLAFSFTYDDLNRFKSAREMGEEVSKVLQDRPAAIYGRNRSAIHYYVNLPGGRPLEHLEALDTDRLMKEESEREKKRQLDEFLAQPGACLIVDEVTFHTLLEDFPEYRQRLRRLPVAKELRLGSRDRAVIVTAASP